jgi:hypothetical protein
MASMEDLNKARCEAWKSISSYASVTIASKNTQDYDMNVQILLDAIEKKKKELSKIMDQIDE